MAHTRSAPEAVTGDGFTGQVPSRKRKREYTEADATLARIFESLGSEIEKDRISAAVELLNLYQTSRASSDKILVRLMRGLCSSRKAARPGFFIALTEVLKATRDEPGILEKQSFAEAMKVVLEKLKSETKTEGGASTQEKRDYLLGRLTGYSAIVHSAVLVVDETGTPFLNEVLQEVWKVSQQSPQWTEQCGKVYFDLVTIAVLNHAKEPIELVLNFLTTMNMLKTPEGVAVWLAASNSTLDARLPKHVWHHKDPLCRKELSTIAKVMKGSSAQSDSHGKEQLTGNSVGSRRDTPHFAWHPILARFFGVKQQSMDETIDASNNFRQFWLTVVDDVYFASAASPERKALGFRIFSILLSTGPTWACEQALSPKMMNCVVNQWSKDERLLHHAAISLLNNLKSRANSEPSLAQKIVLAMNVGEADKERHKADLERINRSKLFLKELFDEGDEQVAEAIVEEYQRILSSPGVDNQQEADAIRRVISESLLTFLRLRKQKPTNRLSSEIRWKQTIMHTLIRCACLQSDISNSSFAAFPPISEASRESFKSKLLSCLRELFSTQSKEDVDIILIEVGKFEEYGVKSYIELSRNELASKAVSDGFEVLNDMIVKESKTEQGELALLRAFKLLFSIAIIQLCCGESDAISVMEDLKECYDGFKTRRKSQTGGFDAIVEIILGFCSNPSALYRTLSEQIFQAFASEISTIGLESLLHVLEQEENLAGQRELFDQHNEEQTVVNGIHSRNGTHDSEGDPEDSDVEIVNAASEDESSENEESSENDSGTSSEEGEEEVNGADEALNDSLGQILQTRKPILPDVNGDDEGEESSSSDESMDDEQMEALGIDNQLSAIFAQRKSRSNAKGKISEKKREQKDAKQNILNFKNRVLDLVNIYVKQQHASPTALSIILPLVRLIGRTRTPQIAKKSSDLLKTYFDTAKSKGMPLSASSQDIWDMLKDVHEELLVFPSNLHANASSRCSIFLARLMMQKQEEGAMGRIIRLYADTHEQRFKTTSKAPATFWTEFVNWSVAMG